MCGILGQISFCGSNDQVPCLDLLHHRGPDGKGEFINENNDVYLGHTRLAILEPTPAGRQPMTDSSQRFTIVFNGEIYNHLVLREQLPDVLWRGNSDTETLLELFSHMSLAALPQIKGMFAFALYDRNDNSILLVRDRLGIKPLWYSLSGEKLSFSSEIRALIQGPGTTLCKAALSEYIAFGRMPGTGEIFDGVQSLAPGSWLKVDPNGRRSQGEWWSKEGFSKSKIPLNHRELAKRVNKLVTAAVEQHLISDVGIGSFLSGGIDSSIVTLVAGKALGKNLQTFTIGFPQKTHDERSIARLVAQKAGTTHHELEISPDQCLVWVREAVNSLDLPSVDAINTYIVSRAVKDSGLKVALSGLGGDELFGGYPSFKKVPWLQLLNLLPKKAIPSLISLFPNSVQEKLYGLEDYSAVGLATASRRFTSVSTLSNIDLDKGIPYIPPPPPGLDSMGLISWAEIYGYMIPMLLRDSDQMSMAVGLEIRVPFLDHELLEEVVGVQEKFKQKNGIKGLLVEAFKQDLPVEVYDRPKQGFTLPMDAWIRGPLNTFVEEGLLIVSDHMSTIYPLAQLEAYNKGRVHWTRLWLWVTLGHWLSRQDKAGRQRHLTNFYQ